jgi:hypothetical protein
MLTDAACISILQAGWLRSQKFISLQNARHPALGEVGLLHFRA